jgi:hypothetical protein
MHHITLTTVTFLRFVRFTFWNYYILQLLRLGTIMFSDARLSDLNVVLCYILSQYLHKYSHNFYKHYHGNCNPFKASLSLLGYYIPATTFISSTLTAIT